jgi:hypothetical protein
LKLTAPFTSSNAAIRGVTWLVTFLLLTFAWILLLPLMSLDNLFHRFGNIGMTGSQSVLAITLLPPLTLTLLGWIGLRVFNPPAVPAIAPANAAPVQSSQIAVTSPAEVLRIAAWSVVTPLGDAGVTIARSQAQDKIFRPDKNIRNTEGHPVHTAIVEEIPLAILNYPSETRSRSMRISAMLVSVLDTLHDQQNELARSAAVSATVYWLVPATMPLDNETRLCFSIAWAHSSWGNIDYSLHLLSAATESAYSVVSNLRELTDQRKMPYVLLLAADSLLDPDELVSSLNQGKVFSSKLPDGFVPAEGAAGLLLVDSAFATSAHFTGLCTLGPVHREQRASDRGVKGKVDSSTLNACITDAMTVAETSADEIGTVISDTDHRFSRSAEVTQAMEQTLPRLDALSDRINPMAFAGYFGAASDLIHMALAAEVVATTEQAALVVSVAGPRQTTAMMILPYQR